MAVILESFLLELLIAAACLVATLYIYMQRKFTYWKDRNVPYMEPVFPFGNFKDLVFFRKSLGEILTDWYKALEGHRFGGNYTFQKPGLILRDPELIKDVLVKNFSAFHDRGFYMNEELDPLAAHLFMMSGEKWKNLRNKLSPTFTSGKMKMMFQTLVDCGFELQDCLKEKAYRGDTFEVKDILARYTTDVISSCAFGIQCNCLKNEDAEFRKWGRRAIEPTIKSSIIGIISNFAPIILDTFKIPQLEPAITKYFLSMVRDTVEYREKNNVVRKDFMQLLIQLKNKGWVDSEMEEVGKNEDLSKDTSNRNVLSMNDLSAQVFVFFVAGFETSSTTMTFCLYELAVNPDIQELLRNEIDEILSIHGDNISYEAIQEMTYLDKVVEETLRKYPPVPMLNRECTKSYTIPGTDVVLDEKTPIIIPAYALHHDPQHYPNPEKFDPERFSEEEKAKRHHYVYLPFGEGPRICIGMRFGLMQTKVGLVSLLSKYRFSVSEKNTDTSSVR